jgi:hypothetical protein
VTVVESSVWIGYLHRHKSPATAKLTTEILAGKITLGDLVSLEILQGSNDDTHAARLERDLWQSISACCSHKSGRPDSTPHHHFTPRFHEPALVTSVPPI